MKRYAPGRALLATVLVFVSLTSAPHRFQAAAQTSSILNGETSDAEARETSPVGERMNDAAPIANNGHRWGAVTLFHGLPSNRVRAVTQTPDGIVWCGTDAGLARFDGRRTQTVTEINLAPGATETPVVSSLESNARGVLALYVDAGGVLWVGTVAGAWRRVNERWSFVEETRNQPVTAITSFSDRIILAASGALLACRQLEDGRLDITRFGDSSLLRREGDEANGTSARSDDDISQGSKSFVPITSLAAQGGRLLVGTRGRGLLVLEDGALREAGASQRPFFVEALAVADAKRGGAAWLGAQTSAFASGLYVQRDAALVSARTFVRSDAGRTGTITSLDFDDTGDLWIGTGEQGAFRRHPDGRTEHWTFQGTGGGLVSDHINCVFVDREGVVWFGTDRGLARYDRRGVQTETIAETFDGNFVRVLYRASGGQILCGTNRGLFVSRDGQTVWRAIEEFSNKTVHALVEDARGRLFVGTSSGLYVAPTVDVLPQAVESGARFKPVDAGDANEAQGRGSVRALAVFRGAVYVAVYGHGVARLETVAGNLRRIFITMNENTGTQAREAVSLHAQGDERLWIGTTRGVMAFDGVNFTVNPLASLPECAVWSMVEEDARGLWLATSCGLYRRHDAGLDEMLTGEDVRAVRLVRRAGGAQAWCATNGHGLAIVEASRAETETDRAGAPLVSRLDVEQGMPSQNMFAMLPLDESKGAALKDTGGASTMLIGTNRGLARYTATGVPPLLAWTRIGTRRLVIGAEAERAVTLDYPQSALSIEAAALSSRTFPEGFQYRFRLRDANGELLRERLSRDASFVAEGLAAGTYRVEAQAFGIDLHASAPLALDVRVAAAPPPWTTIGLSGLLALALGGLGWGAYQNRRIRQTGTELVAVNRELTGARLALATEAEAERRRIARDLHDQTLADLRRLQLLCDESPRAASVENGDATLPVKVDAATLRGEVESISTEVRRICEDLSPSVLENVGLLAALEWALTDAVAHLNEAERFAIEFIGDDDLDERLHLALSVQIQIYRILQEALSNICRHARASRVRLTVTENPAGSLQLCLEDDGRDFSPHERRSRRGRGIVGMFARASLINAEMAWKPRDEGGTSWTLSVPNAIEVGS